MGCLELKIFRQILICVTLWISLMTRTLDIICNAHLQRELDYFCTTEKYVWAQKMKIYLYSLFLEVNYLKSFGETKRHHTEFKFIRKKYKKLLREAQAEMAGLFTKERKNEKVVNLYNRLKKYELEILSFAKNYEVPFTNNQIIYMGSVQKTQHF